MLNADNTCSCEKNEEYSFLCLISRWYRKIPSILVFAFIVSFITVFLIHGYCFTNFLTNHDNALISNGAGGIIENGGAVSSGRFLLTTINSFSSSYTMPWLNGLLASFYFALTVCSIVALFEIRHRFSCVLIAVILASFPAAASTFSFMYTADAYFFALMLSAFAALVTQRFRFGFVAGALMLAASLGIYQAYFPVCASLLVFSLIFELYKASAKPLAIIAKCLRALTALAAGMLLYKIVLDMALKISGAELSSYLGIDHMWYIPFWDLGQILSNAYKYTFQVYRANPFFPDAAHIIYLLGLACLLMLSVFKIIENAVYKEPFRLLVLLLLIAISPLACSLMFVMSRTVHTVMMYALALPLVAGAAALDKADFHRGKHIAGYILRNAICFLVLLSLLSLSYINTIVVNKAYLKMDIVYETTYALCTKLSARMEMTEGYEIGMPVVLAGSLTEENRPTLNEQMTELDTMSGIPTERGLLLTNIISGFCRYYIGVNLVEADNETYQDIISNPALEDMPLYPYNGSIDIIDGVMVVKLGNNY